MQNLREERMVLALALGVRFQVKLYAATLELAPLPRHVGVGRRGALCGRGGRRSRRCACSAAGSNALVLDG